MATIPTFEQVYAQHRNMVFNLCLHYLQQTQDAEQDVFVKIHFKLAEFDGRATLKTWIYRITINHCLDILKARRRQKRLAVITSLFGSSREILHEVPEFSHPGVLLEDREALEILFLRIHELPENQKTALILRYLDHLPPPEIADIMQCSLKAVESLLQRAKSGLEKKIRNGF